MDFNNIVEHLLGLKRPDHQQGLQPQITSMEAPHTDQGEEEPSVAPRAECSVLPSLSFMLADQEQVTGGGVLARSSAGLQFKRMRPPLTLTASLPDALQVVARPAKEPGGNISSSTVLSVSPSLTATYTWPNCGHVSATLDMSAQKYTLGAMWKGDLAGSIPSTVVRVKWKEQDQSINIDSTSEIRYALHGATSNT